MLVYQDTRGWLYYVRQGLGEPPVYKAFYNKKPDALPSSTGWHGVRTLEYRNNTIDATADLISYARKHKMTKKKSLETLFELSMN